MAKKDKPATAAGADDLDTPLKGSNPRDKNKHRVKRYESRRGGSRTLPKPDAAAGDQGKGE